MPDGQELNLVLVATIRLHKESIMMLVVALVMFVDPISQMSTAESRALMELGNEWRCFMACSASDCGAPPARAG
jgi:hypothetical protein